ncbi:unnamed protein product [Prunus armeniaca]|uniref:Uncharacterized protein n=1 Tax=Prunus armeniaca TaxID=36596 RepID=A0A6J5X2V8_PRUAR|nr:unnamed protein product [Prunus armeniaca]
MFIVEAIEFLNSGFVNVFQARQLFTLCLRVELLLCCIDTLQSNMGMANAYSMINQELQNSVSEKEYQEFKFFTTAEEKSGWLDGQGMEAMGWGR